MATGCPAEPPTDSPEDLPADRGFPSEGACTKLTRELALDRLGRRAPRRKGVRCRARNHRHGIAVELCGCCAYEA